MATPIKDGTGKGYIAKVSSSNELYTRSRSLPISAAKNIEGQFFSVNTGILTLPVTFARIFHFTYTESSKLLSLETIRFGWNGGSTNYNRPAYIKIMAGETAPTTNTLSKATVNQNLGSSEVMQATSLVWDGNGDGMDGYSPGAEITSFIISQGETVFDYDGKFIISPLSKFSIIAKGEEEGEISISISAYMIETGIDY